MEEQVPWEKIQHYLKNDEEPFDDGFISWLKANDKNQAFWKEIQLMYSLTGELPDEFSPNEREAWKKIDRRISAKDTLVPVSRFLLRIAASFLLVAFGASAGWFLTGDFKAPVYTEIYSPYGHKTKVTLPDSSLVWLNGDSKLTYETSFAKSREVELSGEALFDVKKDKRLFSVRSGKLKVEVYGTTFNFKRYPDDRNTEVALLEGRVGLFYNDQLIEQMTPGEVADFDLSTNKLRISGKNINQIISWSTDELIIENEKFEDVISYLERWYGVEIETSANLNLDQRLSFKVKTESLQELLSIIDRVSPINYDIDGKKVIINNRNQ